MKSIENKNKYKGPITCTANNALDLTIDTKYNDGINSNKEIWEILWLKRNVME